MRNKNYVTRFLNLKLSRQKDLHSHQTKHRTERTIDYVFESTESRTNFRNIHAPGKKTEPGKSDRGNEDPISGLYEDGSSRGNDLRVNSKEKYRRLRIQGVREESFLVALE